MRPPPALSRRGRSKPSPFDDRCEGPFEKSLRKDPSVRSARARLVPPAPPRREPLVLVDPLFEGRFTHIGELRARTNRTIAAARPTATRMQLSITGACTSAATATKPALTRTRRITKISFLWCGLRLKLPPGVFARTQTLVDVS
eukprot:scaffold424_cov69-Phaeocystis_antarctica.AAC.17